MGGTVRAYRQVVDMREEGRAGPPRAHGTVKYTHPKDPSRPLLTQVHQSRVGNSSAGEYKLRILVSGVRGRVVGIPIYQL